MVEEGLVLELGTSRASGPDCRSVPKILFSPRSLRGRIATFYLRDAKAPHPRERTHPLLGERPTFLGLFTSHAVPIQLSFPLDRLDRPENFLSLLYYFGLLSIRDVAYGVPRLGIPNQTVKRLMTWAVPSPGASSGIA